MLVLLGMTAFGNQAEQSVPNALAGSVIESRTVVSYTREGERISDIVRVSSFVVDQLIELELAWHDQPERFVVPGSQTQVIAFELSNRGNGIDRVTIDSIGVSDDDDFNLDNVRVYVDTNGNRTFEADQDIEAFVGVSEFDLDAFHSVYVFLVGDVPADMEDGHIASNFLSVRSVTEDPENENGGLDLSEKDVVELVRSEAIAVIEGTIRVQFVYVNIVKLVDVQNQLGTDDLITGSIVTCYLDITTEGSLTAQQVLIEDIVPVEATYLSGTLALNEEPLSDALDTDVGSVDQLQDESLIMVNLGAMAPGSAPQRISFEMMIN